jgi:hypothetical protein
MQSSLGCMHQLPENGPTPPTTTTPLQAVRRRYLGASLAEYAREVDPHATHFLALAPGQVGGQRGREVYGRF